ncbi:MAG: lytic transglycosylase F [Lewinellaceae bacterium]|nr:lytic transglycosylase F [Lewinellaceae bacterium]
MSTSCTFSALFGTAILLLGCQPNQPSSPTADESAVATDTVTPWPAYEQIDDVIGLTERWTGDLPGIVERRRLRVLVPYSQTTYYLDGTERKGIAYEAMIHFEKYLNTALGKSTAPPYVQMVFVPVARDQLIPALLDGYGDLIAENLTVTPQREQLVAFSEPLLTGAREVIATGPNSPQLTSLDDLPGRTLHLRKSSSFFEHVTALNDTLQRAGKPLVKVIPLDEHLEDEEVLEMLSEGLLELTIVDQFKGKLWQAILPDIRIREDLCLRENQQIAWAVRPDCPELKSQLDAFVQKNKKGSLLGNMLFNRYYQDENRVRQTFNSKDRVRFFALQKHFTQYGQQYGLDWMLLAALGFQESRYNQQLRSRAGAVGIMQVLPTTARDPRINVPNITREEDNIHAGTKFLRYIIDSFFISKTIDSLNAGLFGLASYNAGPYRILELRRKAAAQGLNPDVWFNNVEIIAAHEIGRETVQYVSNIYKYYCSYRYLYHYYQQTGKTPWDKDTESPPKTG